MNEQGQAPRDAPRVRRVVAFVVPFALLTYYGMRDGSYDLVVRQEEALAVWWVIGLGFAFGALPRVPPPRAAIIPLAAIGLLIIWTALSLTWTSSDERTLAEVTRVFHYAGILVLIWSVVGVRTWRSAAAGVAAAAVLVTLFALGSRLSPNSFAVAEAANHVFGIKRLNYPFYYWNALAAWSVMAMAMAMIWSAHARSVVVRAAALAVVPACALTAYFTDARQSLVAVALAAALVLLLSHNRVTYVLHLLAAVAGTYIAIVAADDQPAIAGATGGKGAGSVLGALLLSAAICAGTAVATRLLLIDRARTRAPVGRIAAAVAAVLVLAVALGPARDRINRAWDEFRDETPAAAVTDPSTAGTRIKSLNPGGARYDIWSTALDSFKEHSFKGTGAGTFEFTWNASKRAGFLRDAHSLYFEQLAELGIPGLFFTLVLLLSIAAYALLGRRKLRNSAQLGAHGAMTAAFGLFLFHAGVDWMWETTAVTILGLTCGAIAVAAGPVRRFRMTPAIRYGVAGVALIGVLVQLPALASTTSVRRSQEAYSAGDVARALEHADDAVDAQSWAASPFVQRALLAEAIGDLDAARADLRRAIDREKLDWRNYFLLARVEAEDGRPRQALAAYRRARKLRPKSSFIVRFPPVAP